MQSTVKVDSWFLHAASTDSNAPEIGDKIAGLQRRNYAEHPEVAALVAQMPSFRVPDGKG